MPDTEPVPQTGEPVYAEKLTVDEFRLDPTRPAVELDRIVRAGNPRPGAWTVVGGRRVKVWRAHAEAPDESADAPGDPRAPGRLGADGRLATAAGLLALDEVQPEGKRAMPADAWRRGLRGAPCVDRSRSDGRCGERARACRRRARAHRRRRVLAHPPSPPRCGGAA